MKLRTSRTPERDPRVAKMLDRHVSSRRGAVMIKTTAEQSLNARLGTARAA